jgi:hypothetical protein
MTPRQIYVALGLAMLFHRRPRAWLTSREIAEYLGLSRAMFHAAIADGKVRAALPWLASGGGRPYTRSGF